MSTASIYLASQALSLAADSDGDHIVQIFIT